MTMSLSDALGVLIAFLTVILLLSMLVTALVQSTQSIFRTRGRNLHKALVRLMVKDLGMDAKSARSAAHKLLDGTLASLIKREPRSGPARLVGPAVSWVEPEEIPAAARRAGLVPDAQGEAPAPRGERLDDHRLGALQEGIEGMRRPMQKRLGFTVRLISIGWALVVAVAFQLSTLELLRDLSVNEKLRGEYLAVTPEALRIAVAAAQEPQGEVEEQAGDAEPAEPSAEGDALPAEPSADEVLARLSPLSIELWAKPDYFCARGLLGEGEEARGSLSIERLTRCEGGDLAGEHVVGVAITAFLLTFGAPFWFEQLKSVVGLRDALRKSDDEDGEKKAEGEAGKS